MDCCRSSYRYVAHRLTKEESQRILLTYNQAGFAALPPRLIVPILADQDLYIGSELVLNTAFTESSRPMVKRHHHRRREEDHSALNINRISVIDKWLEKPHPFWHNGSKF